MNLYITIHVLVFLSLFFELFSLRTKKVVMILWCVFFTLFGGLRWRIGGDWDQYYDHFLFSKWSNIFNYDRYGNGVEILEPGFVFFNVVIKSIFGEFYIYNLILVGFIQFTYYKFCNYFFPKNPILPYCLLMLLASNYFPVRAGLSIGICYWAWMFIKERRLLPYLIIVAAAFMIHQQAIVLLPCYWLGYINLKSKWYLIIYPLIAIFSHILQDYFINITSVLGGSITEKAYGYTQFETEGFKGASYAGWILNYFFLCVYLYIRKVGKLTGDVWFTVLLNSFMIYTAIFMVFQNGMGDLSRLSSIFFPVQCILLISSTIFFINSQKSLVVFFTVMSFIAYYVYKLPDCWSGYYFKQTCVPYKTVFDYNII